MFCLFNNIYFNFNFFNKKFLIFLLKNDNSLKSNYTNLFKSNNFFYKNNLIISKEINFFFKINNKYYYSFNYLNKYLFKIFFDSISSLLSKNSNFLFLDINNKMYLPLYNYLYGLKNLYSQKNFFFLNKNFLTLNNWFYKYSFFVYKNKISFLVCLNYFEFNKFFKIFSRLNLPIFSFTSHNMKPVYLDYYYKINFNQINFFKILTFNYISSLYFKYYNFNNYFYRLNYLHFFNKLKSF